MNLVQAFKKRKRLKEEINKLSEMLNNYDGLMRESTEAEKIGFFDDKTALEAYETYKKTIDELIKLNKAINEANIQIKPLVDTVEILKNQRNTLTKINETIRYVIKKKQYYPENDKTVTYISNLDQSLILKDLDTLNIQIDDFEEKIQKLNINTNIEGY